jgi:signal transduction histidine kinase
MERLAAIGQAMGMVLHEIKNIIQLASFSQEYLKIGVAKQNPKFLNIGIEGVGKAIKEMDGFSYEILSLTKDYKISPQAIDWPGLLKELEEDLRAKAIQFKIELQLECDLLIERIEGESRSLYRMLLNIIKNAMEAADSTKEKSYVRARIVSKDPEFYEITVEDNGKGMNDETKAKLFQAFFSTKGEKGTGLGLIIIDRTIKAHHGKITVESEFGKGTRFLLTLPKKLPQ